MANSPEPEAGPLADLAAFAAIEVASRDVEPWADLLAYLLRAGRLDEEAALWLVKLYNAYDDLGSAWAVYRRWPTPAAWYTAPDAADAADYPCTQERRNLRGGRVLRHLAAYAGRVVAAPQAAWLAQPVIAGHPEASWRAFTAHVRPLWGVGRQTAFEWAEFAAKVGGLALSAPDADLWESEGPRRSLQRLYGNPRPTLAWLNARANECRGYLASEGVALAWEDFETVICDFNVMRDGRYYPGKHLAALRAEIEGIEDPAGRAVLREAFGAVVPEPWALIPPGVNKARQVTYRDTGVVLTAP